MILNWNLINRRVLTTVMIGIEERQERGREAGDSLLPAYIGHWCNCYLTECAVGAETSTEIRFQKNWKEYAGERSMREKVETLASSAQCNAYV